MARMTLKAVHADGERRRWTLSERIVDENLGSYRHVPQSRERLRRATPYAETPRRRAVVSSEDRHDDRHNGAHEDRHEYRPAELADLAWLRAWTDAARHARRGVPARQQPGGGLGCFRTPWG